VKPPTSAIARAFGVAGSVDLQRLPGGQGQTWHGAGLVFKLVACPAETAWVCDVYEGWPSSAAVRVPEPARSQDGSWVYAGWAAHHWVEGSDVSIPSEIETVRVACEAFSDVVARLQRPGFLDLRSDPWSYGDRVAWEGAEPQGSEPTQRLLAEASAALQPVRSPAQVIHGDLGGNVLVARGLRPAVIDWPPYFRPRGFALAVVAVDAVSWSGAPAELLEAWSDVPEWSQLLLRALIFRVATDGRRESLGTAPGGSTGHIEQHRLALSAVLGRMR
jgi:uncharacterized protein (TIGR02569 family)